MNENFVRVEIITASAKLNGLKMAVDKLGVTGMTVTQVMGCGVQKGTPEYELGINNEMDLLPKQLIMLVVKDSMIDKLIDTVKKELYTGHIGDGKIFVSDMKNIVRIRTGEEQADAIS
jgi:nitrogen regulatory protein PII